MGGWLGGRSILLILWISPRCFTNHLNESCWEVLSFGTVYYTVQGSSNF